MQVIPMIRESCSCQDEAYLVEEAIHSTNCWCSVNPFGETDGGWWGQHISWYHPHKKMFCCNWLDVECH